MNNFHHKPFILLGILGCDSCSNLHKSDVTKNFAFFGGNKWFNSKKDVAVVVPVHPLDWHMPRFDFSWKEKLLLHLNLLSFSFSSVRCLLPLMWYHYKHRKILIPLIYIKSLEVWDTKEYQDLSISQEQCCSKCKHYKTSPKYSKKSLNGNRSIPNFLRCCPVGPDGSRASNWVSRMFETLR